MGGILTSGMCVDKVTFLGLLGWLHSLKEAALTAVEVCDTVNSSVRDFYIQGMLSV